MRNQTLKEALDRHLKIATRNQTGRRLKANFDHNSLASPNFTTVAPIKKSEYQHVFEGDVNALLAELKPKKILNLASDEIINEIDFFDDCLMLYISKVSQIKVLFAKMNENSQEKDEKLEFYEVNLGPGNNHGVVKPGVNHNSHQKHIRFFVDTPFSYAQAMDFEVNSGNLRIIDQAVIAGRKFDTRKFEVTVVNAPTLDGVRVPITLIHPKGYLNSDGLPRRLNDPRKLLLKSYGCYGLNLTVDFEISNWSLLERGWTIAYAHVRGGSELGKQWHMAATKLNKFKSVTDIVAAANFLVAEGFTHSSLLCAASNSAGAGLLAAAVNQQPQLFKAVELSAPFLDIKGCLTKPDLPLSKSDYHEFGDPINDPRAYDSISSLCPYTNLRASEYPAMLLTAFKDDYRTPLWNVFKYTAKFRSLAKSPTRVREFCDKNLAVIIDEGSHLGTSDNEANIERSALSTAFFEWIIEERSNDVEKKVRYSLLKKLFN